MNITSVIYHLRTYISGKIRVFQRLIDRQSLLGIERERLLEEVQCLGGGFGEDRLEWATFSDGQRAYVVARASRGDAIELLQRRRANYVEDEVELVPIVTPWEERAAGEELCKDTPYCPNVDRLEGQGIRTTSNQVEP